MVHTKIKRNLVWVLLLGAAYALPGFSEESPHYPHCHKIVVEGTKVNAVDWLEIKTETECAKKNAVWWKGHYPHCHNKDGSNMEGASDQYDCKAKGGEMYDNTHVRIAKWAVKNLRLPALKLPSAGKTLGSVHPAN